MPRIPRALSYALAALLPQAVLLAARARRINALEAEVARLARATAAAEQQKNEFLGTLSHELRTPLNAILGWVQLLRMHIDDPRQQQHALDVIERNARRQACLVTDLLDMSRIVTGRLHLAREQVVLDDVIREAAASLTDASVASRVAVRVEAPKGVHVRGDRARLRQIFVNLLSNALKFTPAGGYVTIRLTAEAQAAVVEVIDTGVGIAPEVVPRLFESFRQGETGLTRRYGGLGLGLTLVRTLVELHGGTVSATSAGLGRGATFTVRLPRSEAGAYFAA